LNKTGKVVYEHFGEGEYAVTENNIRYLLGIKTGTNTKEKSSTLFSPQTPETYLGYARIDKFASPEKINNDAVAEYSYPDSLAENAWSLHGSWVVAYEKIISKQTGAAIKIHFNAQNVYAVMGTSGKAVKVKVMYNGAPLTNSAGSDVKDGILDVSGHTLYNIIALPQATSGELELISTEPSLEIYTFTFGS
jgi:hypothetical protein